MKIITSMKHNYLILTAIAFLLGLILFACKKHEEETLTPKITNNKVETTATTATFTWTVEWRGKLISVVEVSENEDMSHSQYYGSETETENHNFTVTVTDLEEATKYYYRHLVWNQHYVNNKFEMEVKNFTTKTDVPKVKTIEVTDVTRTTATVIGEVTDDCGAEVTDRGVCWSTSHNPTTSGSHLNSGTGTGTYSVALTNLEVGKTYYVRAYAKNSKGTAYGDELDFATGDAVKPTVITAEITNIGWRTATGGGDVTDDGGATVTERGICWSTSHNPEVDGDYASNGIGTGAYTVNMTDLSAETTYYVRAYAKNSANLIGYGDEVSFHTDQVPCYTISVSAIPTNGGTVTGGGNYNHGQSCTLRATPDDDYTFLRWTKNGTQVSTEPNYTFDVTESGNYTANFTNQPQTFTVSVSANLSNGGVVSGGGTYETGQSCTVRATANSGYVFNNWTENGNVVSQAANYTFPVVGNRNLVANFIVAQQTYTVSVSADPSNEGTVEGGGSYGQGQSCTVTATPMLGCRFVNWTENGNVVSSSASYEFTVTGNRTLVAHFQMLSYTISASTNPSSAGSITGSGTYNYGQTCTLKALPATGYSFVRWTKDGADVSTSDTYTFIVTESAEYVAHFQTQAYTITTSSSPSNGGSTTGDGIYNHGQSCTLVATHAEGYSFIRWTKNGTQVSTDASYTFSVTESGAYVAHFQTQSYVVSVSSNPNNGGVVSGGGNYNYNQTCTVTAIANAGYNFTNWTENGNVVSSSASCEFTVTGNRTLVANFTPQSYTISVSANPSNGGGVSGGGTYNYGQSCTVTATATSGFGFVNWTENGNVVSSSVSYTFTVIGSRTLLANFIVIPEGAINGLFTINENGDQVRFSQGNLQYNKITNEWSFMEHQYDIVETDGQDVGENYADQNIVSLFGWGTSGYNHNNACYQPWSTSGGFSDYYAYGGSYYNLNSQTGQADWGYNSIINGGNQENQWRTLTGGNDGEWRYVLHRRATTTGIRYAKAQITGTSNGTVNGIILFPDDWSASNYIPSNYNQSGVSFNSNPISVSQWPSLEAAGAVFLPTAGHRMGSISHWAGSEGSYNSVTHENNNNKYYMYFNNSNLNSIDGTYRTYGHSVRLVCPAEN